MLLAIVVRNMKVVQRIKENEMPSLDDLIKANDKKMAEGRKNFVKYMTKDLTKKKK